MSMPNLIIQIPCFNEEHTLPSVISGIPPSIDGIHDVHILVIDDGSTDGTANLATQLGVDYLIRNRRNLGLAKTFSRGLEASVFLGADILVNTDGDNQYAGADIEKLIAPILASQADVVIGCRDIQGHKEFSPIKKFLQQFGSIVVNQLAGLGIPDTTSGFRAMNRTAAMKLSLMSNFSYTLEMLIQANRMGLKVAWVPIHTNPKTRESRLFKSTRHFIFQQLKVILKGYIFYYPIRFFGMLASASFLLTLIFSVRIVYYLLFADPAMTRFKVGSGFLVTFTSVITVFFVSMGLLGTVLSGLRDMLIDVRNRIKNVELHQHIPPFDFEISVSETLRAWPHKSKTPQK
jgi:glycosyltransferase involved in cell wall biosynthesis